MTTCGSFRDIFDTLLPENTTLLESLSLNPIKPVKPTDQTLSFAEIFGELHFKEASISSPSIQPYVSTSSPTEKTNYTNSHKNSDSFSSLSSESLQLCTEGLGFESSDDVEYLKDGTNESWETFKEKESVKRYVSSRVHEYPPPISSIGRSGKPWVCFKSYRSEGRFVLEEIRIPTHEFLHAYREDGRLKLNFVHPDDELSEEEDADVESIDEEEEEQNDDHECSLL